MCVIMIEDGFLKGVIENIIDMMEVIIILYREQLSKVELKFIV